MIGAVADTHALIWYLLDSPRLSAPALEWFEKCRLEGTRVGVSSISIVEIIYLVEKDRIPSATIPLLAESLSEPPTLLEIVSFSETIAWAVQQVPREQVPDLPDRIIAATAQYLDVPLITRDRKIMSSGVYTIW
ncbi:MAG: type II toxin-antitoxin system VapC family toxin [Anaerolineae bacterium]|nr:type II toxin-antitoxin system VapC family toxin [Anaerolineae bacterium]